MEILGEEAKVAYGLAVCEWDKCEDHNRIIDKANSLPLDRIKDQKGDQRRRSQNRKSPPEWARLERHSR